MSDLLDIQSKLQDTNAALQRAHQLLAEDPQDTEFSSVLRSLELRLQRLQDAFQASAASMGRDVCKYRLVTSDERYPVSAFAELITEFQTCISVLFDALQNGPKERSRISAEIAQKTTLDVGYMFPGSLGIAFTVPNEHGLFEAELDSAVATMFDIVHVANAEELLRFSQKVGPAPIRKIHEWAYTNINYGMTTSIEWEGEGEHKFETTLQPEEAARLVKIIEDTKPEVIEPLEVAGILVGGDLDRRTFHLKVAGADDIEGGMSDEFVWPAGKELPLAHRFRARLNKKTVTYLAVEKEAVSWELLALAEI